jgi:hypothetical protein
MVRTLRKNLPNSVIVHVYDISQEAMDKFSDFEGIQTCQSAKELCEKSVCFTKTGIEEADAIEKLEMHNHNST